MDKSPASPKSGRAPRKGLVRKGVPATRAMVKTPILRQISGRVPGELKDQFDALVARKGLRKEFVLADALRHHLRALEELPVEYLIPTRMVLTAASSRVLAASLLHPLKPSAELKTLFRNKPHVGDH
jgi:hypothetical protein